MGTTHSTKLCRSKLFQSLHLSDLESECKILKKTWNFTEYIMAIDAFLRPNHCQTDRRWNIRMMGMILTGDRVLSGGGLLSRLGQTIALNSDHAHPAREVTVQLGETRDVGGT